MIARTGRGGWGGADEHRDSGKRPDDFNQGSHANPIYLGRCFRPSPPLSASSKCGKWRSTKRGVRGDEGRVPAIATKEPPTNQSLSKTTTQKKNLRQMEEDRHVRRRRPRHPVWRDSSRCRCPASQHLIKRWVCEIGQKGSSTASPPHPSPAQAARRCPHGTHRGPRTGSTPGRLL